jgi:hypothetical protein
MILLLIGEYIWHKPLDKVAMYNILHNVQLGLSCIQNYGYEGACRQVSGKLSYPLTDLVIARNRTEINKV